jgi:hypothetical protein
MPKAPVTKVDGEKMAEAQRRGPPVMPENIDMRLFEEKMKGPKGR